VGQRSCEIGKRRFGQVVMVTTVVVAIAVDESDVSESLSPCSVVVGAGEFVEILAEDRGDAADSRHRIFGCELCAGRSCSWSVALWPKRGNSRWRVGVKSLSRARKRRGAHNL
jgi:hypothetical protein